MRAVLSSQDIDRYRKQINQNGITGVVKVYTELLDKGYDYAGWAKGVAAADTVTGRAAILFMKNTSGKQFSKEELNGIRVDMAKGYLDALEQNIKKGENRSDISFEQARKFHGEVFKKHSLSLNNWTLEVPMRLIGNYEGGKHAQEAAWQRIMKTQGDYVDALAVSNDLSTKVSDYSDGYYYKNRGGSVISDHEYQTSNFAINTKHKVSEIDKQLAQEWVRNISIIRPFFMSENKREQPYQYAQAIDGFTPELQALHEKARTLLTEFNQRENIAQSSTEFENTAAFITASMHKKKMVDADIIGKMDGKLHVIHDTLKLDVAIVDPHIAAQTPVAESVAQSKQTEQQFEYETQQRQLAQSQSRGMVLS
ncbi:hypothetical protein HMPREF2753_04855 [Neisseria sp. HMSC071C03]|jgi:putative RTX toxin exported protein|uniref:Uncharacterized protein n=1 Tax=Morococcus cerebrosus TaxID=1056807 RepID=A0A0C1EIW7_9NEIS|nr:MULTISPECIES: hypothetical protein [Neisseriaceae]KIC08683.1 hypothetical protein MCC93_11190 [Morococcus cerebrosus]OHR43560.1 hypothetical protein HMPREF3054_03375 [Neisseria sp. HMSC071B12]OHR47472.1 hypothetical protein HMPREF2753_04855 [Neisseria sp. HMSC071C03]UNV87391.1 hypothetical protein MON37_00015 [Morococcus cerebrosus]